MIPFLAEAASTTAEGWQTVIVIAIVFAFFAFVVWMMRKEE